MRTAYLSSFACLCFAIASTPADGADCSLKLVASVRTEVHGSGAMLVPANFGGTRKLLLVDTAGFYHALRPGVVKELALSTRENHVVIVTDALGNQTQTVARAPSFSLGQMAPTSVDFMVMANDSLLGSDQTIAGTFVPGVYFRSLDVDLDFHGRKFGLASQDHCEGQVVYWPNNGVAVVPFQLDTSNHIVFPVKVDGHVMRATLDSGASHNVMFTRAARRLGVDVDSGTVTDVGAVGNNPNVRSYQHRFRTLEIEGITVKNPNMILIPDLNVRMPEGPSTSGGRNETRLGAPRSQTGADMLIGMSVLKHLHVYIATKERKLYITAGGAPSPAPPQTAPVEASKPAQ
jgi:hypothetical protein